MIMLTKAWVHHVKRGTRMVNGLVPSIWVVKIGDDKATRRVYEDWSRFRKDRPVPLIVLIKDKPHSVSRKQIDAALVETKRQHDEWLESIS